MPYMTPEDSHRYYMERKTACDILQRCFRCGEQDAYTMNGRRFCADCIEIINEKQRQKRAENPEKYCKRQRETYARLKAERICPTCYKPLPPDETHVRCKTCRAKEAAKKQTRDGGLKMRSENGLCYRCQKNPVMDGGTLCKSCYDKLGNHIKGLQSEGKMKGLAKYYRYKAQH